MELALPYLYVVVAVVSAWGVVGYARGARPEMVNLAGVTISWLATVKLGDSIIDLLNGLARTALFVARGGIDPESASKAAQSVSTVRLVDPAHPETALAILFAAIVAVFFILSPRFGRRRASVPGKALGSVLGAINGYLSAYVVFQNPSPSALVVLTVTLPAGGADALGSYLPALTVVAVGLTLIVALAFSLRATRRSGGTQFAGRRRS